MSEFIEQKIKTLEIYLNANRGCYGAEDVEKELAVFTALKLAEEALYKAKVRLEFANAHIDCEEEIQDIQKTLAAFDALGKS